MPPEQAWWRVEYWSRRIGEAGVFLIFLVGGVTQVTQAADGDFSHVGPWWHALDLERPALPTRAVGAEVATIWEAPVVAPVGGIVERMEDQVPDNPLGICNYANNWGNYVSIRLDQGGWALLAHLRQGSIVVRPGGRVEVGTYLGMVGNSGHSPIPHLYIQVQSSPELGAPTLPFRLANFLSAIDPERSPLQWNAANVPAHGAALAQVPPNPAVQAVLTSVAPASAVWTIEATGRIPRAFRRARFASTTRTTISLSEAGTTSSGWQMPARWWQASIPTPGASSSTGRRCRRY